jgi:hypothetical protein
MFVRHKLDTIIFYHLLLNFAYLLIKLLIINLVASNHIPTQTSL